MLFMEKFQIFFFYYLLLPPLLPLSVESIDTKHIAQHDYIGGWPVLWLNGQQLFK